MARHSISCATARSMPAKAVSEIAVLETHRTGVIGLND